MTGTALRRIPKYFSFVLDGLLFNVAGWIKIPVDVTTPAVVVDNLIAFYSSKIPIKSFLNFLSVTTRTHPNKGQNPKPLHLK